MQQIHTQRSRSLHQRTRWDARWQVLLPDAGAHLPGEVAMAIVVTVMMVVVVGIIWYCTEIQETRTADGKTWNLLFLHRCEGLCWWGIQYCYQQYHKNLQRHHYQHHRNGLHHHHHHWHNIITIITIIITINVVIFQLMKNKSSVENVRLSLVAQFATNNLFVCSFRKVLAIRNHRRLFGDK